MLLTDGYLRCMVDEERQVVNDPAVSSFNLTTALLLLLMLLVVVVGLLTFMLFESTGGVLSAVEAESSYIRCIPVTTTPTPAPLLELQRLNP